MTTPRWRALSSSDQPVAATQRWRLDIAYDGSAFSGFAYQPECTTVVGVLRETLASTLRMDEPVIVGAGRTDSGVHAFAQVVHVDLPTVLFLKARGPDAERLCGAHLIERRHCVEKPDIVLQIALVLGSLLPRRK